MRLQGIYPAIVTPFGADDRVDYPTFKRLVDHLVGNGVAGIAPCGTTGEYYAMTLDERREVLKFFKEYVGNRVQLIAGTNAASTRDVIDLTQYAEQLKYDAVLLAPPYYSLPSQEELLAHYEAVIKNSSIPIVLYNFPLRAGVEITDTVMAPLAATGRICAIKESSGSMGRVFNHVLNYADRVDLCCGSDDQALDYFLWGATSWIAGASTFTTRQHVDLYKLAIAGQWAQAKERMRKLLPLLLNMESGQFNQKAKYGCELMGIPVGINRAPLGALSAEQKRAFKAAFEIAQS